MQRHLLRSCAALWLSFSLLSACQTFEVAAEDDIKALNQTQAPRIFIAGDSTAANYSPERAPQTGWGQTLPYFLNNPDQIRNRAVNGRSTRSFINEGKWAALLAEVEPGDIVLISFGHNDSRDDAPKRFADANTDYRDFLKSFAKDVLTTGAHPVILSSAARRLWEGPAMVETHGLYRANSEIAANESSADYIDLAQRSLTYFETLGKDATKRDFLWLTPLTGNDRFPDGVEDNTHFSELGACGISYVIADAFSEIPKLSSLINKTRMDDNPYSDIDPRPQAVRSCQEFVIGTR